jgi:hypothetical protein
VLILPLDGTAAPAEILDFLKQRLAALDPSHPVLSQ